MNGFVEYVKHAFLYRWNLLIVGAGAAAGIISGSPDVVLPLLLAGEVAFLSLLSTNRRFQNAIDAAALKEKHRGASEEALAKRRQMLLGLSLEDRVRYDELKDKCKALTQIAGSIKGAAAGEAPPHNAHTEGINRLLWIYLKLLFSKNAIERFFEATDKHQILEDMRVATERLETLGAPDDDSPNDKRRRVSLNDQLKTCETRLENYQSATDNYEFIKDELGRLFSKIVSLAEMAISRQDPNYITSEVDIVSDSVESSEKAMSELDFLTGWSASEEVAPNMFEMEEAGPLTG